jgi:hypothetical protein
MAEPEPIDLATAFGAAESAAIERLVFYIPSRDQKVIEFDPAPWVEEALMLLSDIGGSATALPPVDGAWQNPDTGHLVREKIVLVYSYVDGGKFETSIARIREFLHRMGRETDQGEIVCEFDDRLYKNQRLRSGVREVDMARQVILTDQPKRRVVLADAGKRRVRVANLAAQLGAADESEAPASGGSPVSFVAIREELARRRHTSGGRPGLVDADRKKIPITDEVWSVVEKIAGELAEPGFHPSAGQVAGVLLNIVTRELTPGMTGKVGQRLKQDRRTSRA